MAASSGFLRAAAAAGALCILATAGLAQAPRGTAQAQLGTARLSIEYGAPPWNESRKETIERALPVGALWRLGADTRTTFVVAEGDVAIGGQLIEAGGYGLNVRRTGEQEWAFVVYEGSDSTAGREDPQWEIPAQLDAAAEPAGQLLVALAPVKTGAELRVRWGPLALSAPVCAVTTRESELAFGEESATARWFARPAAAAPAAGRFCCVGKVGSFWIGDVDAAFEVELALDGAKARARFTSRERALLAAKVARAEAEADGLRKRAAAAASPRTQQALERAEAALAEVRAEVEALAAPPPLEVDLALTAAKAPTGTFGAELVRRAGKLVLVVDADGKAGETAIDEAKLLPKPADHPR